MDKANPDDLAVEMEQLTRRILDNCSQLEKEGCRGENIKCPFFHVSCNKFTSMAREYLQELEKRRKECENIECHHE